MGTQNINRTLIKFLDNKPKYSQFENERRWLLDKSIEMRLQNTHHQNITDLYIIDTRIRLRMATDSETGKSIYKLTKKYGLGDHLSEPITSFYISNTEYDLFKSLPSKEIKKKRYLLADGNTNYSIDIFEGTHDGLALAEVESESIESLMKIKSPSFALREVTEDKEYSGGYLAFGTF